MEDPMQLRFVRECRSAIVLFVIAVLVPASSQSFNYKDALSKSILYFESQRSGWLPPNQRATWRHHSGLTDGLEHGVDLVGGYYDAGDNIKFGLPMAFTVTMLSWGVIQYGKQIAAAGEYHHALEAIKWGTDYFIKAHTHPYELWVHVGDAATEHECWQRPEDMTSSRQAYKIDKDHPGSDVAAETAAAMAAASIVFRRTNPYYSHLLLYHAQHLFEFGDKFRRKYDDSIEMIKEFYPSKSGYKDELLWAALWLYRATGKSEYLNYAIDNAVAFGGATWAIHEFSWDIKYAGVQVLASMLATEEKHDSATDEIFRQYQSKAEHYMCACLNKTNTVNVKRTPGGLLYIRKWNNMQYVSTAIFLLTVYADHLKSTGQELKCSNGESVSPDDIFNFAKSQVDYILGSNPMNTSYLVGFGPRYSNRVHHRGASTISYKKSMSFIPCMKGFFWYARKEPNPNILFGALVGGPDDHDGFDDRRSNYRQTEACTYNTAPLVGVFAKLNEDESLSSISLLFIFSIVLFFVLLSLHVMREKIKSRMKSFLHSN